MAVGFNLFSLYGPCELVKTSHYETSISRDPRAKVNVEVYPGTLGQALNAEVIGDAPEILPQTGRPTLCSLTCLNVRKQKTGDIAFAPVLLPSGWEMYEWYLKAKQLTVDAGFDFVADFHFFARYMIPINFVMFKHSEQEKMRKLLHNLTEMTVQPGCSVSLPYQFHQ
ncbi:hypothetical protein BDV11DRAFT_176109 [Aspergillus similis]